MPARRPRRQNRNTPRLGSFAQMPPQPSRRSSSPRKSEYSAFGFVCPDAGSAVAPLLVAARTGILRAWVRLPNVPPRADRDPPRGRPAGSFLVQDGSFSLIRANQPIIQANLPIIPDHVHCMPEAACPRGGRASACNPRNLPAGRQAPGYGLPLRLVLSGLPPLRAAANLGSTSASGGDEGRRLPIR